MAEKIVVGYIRVSHPDQKKDGYSVEAQEGLIRDYCKLKGWTLARIYKDEGISGESIKDRPDCQAMLEDAKKKAFQGIVMGKFDRAFRNTKEALETLDHLRELEIDFISISEQVDTTTAMGRMFFTVISAMAQLERELTSERLNAIYMSKFEKGLMVARAPVGYRWNKAKRMMEIDARKAAIVRDVFAMTAAGHSYKEICAKHKLKPQSYYNMVRNRAYLGEIEFDGERRRGIHEPLVDLETFEKANAMLGSKNKIVTRVAQ